MSSKESYLVLETVKCITTADQQLSGSIKGTYLVCIASNTCSEKRKAFSEITKAFRTQASIYSVISSLRIVPTPQVSKM